MCAAVVQPRDASETLLACCVPDLEAHNSIRCCIEDALGDEGCTDSGGRSGWVEGVAYVTVDEGGFAHTWNALKLEAVIEMIILEEEIIIYKHGVYRYLLYKE